MKRTLPYLSRPRLLTPNHHLHHYPILPTTISSSTSKHSMDVVLPPSSGPGYSVIRNLSSSSLHSIASILSTASDSLLPGLDPDEVEVVREDGVRHSKNLLEARKYKKPEFAIKLLEILQHLRAPTYSNKEQLDPAALTITKVPGSLTNAVFFVSYPSKPTVLLRIYGPSSGSLISRPRELHILHVLSSKYRIGPQVYGTFENGRIEEYFESTTLSKAELCDAEISRWVACRMAEMHTVDLSLLNSKPSTSEDESMEAEEIAAVANFKSWLRPASQVLSLPAISPSTLKQFDLASLQKEWEAYMRWLDAHGQGQADRKKVFAHNDAQCGNLLRVKHVKKGSPDHHQIIVVDFEYAAPNHPACDIANHFHEWTTAYSEADEPHISNPSLYPTLDERRNFYKAYLKQSAYLSTGTARDPTEAEMNELDEEVRLWSPAVHAMWSLWGFVQAREDVEAGVEKPELDFDNVGFSLWRAELFRREIRALGV